MQHFNIRETSVKEYLYLKLYYKVVLIDKTVSNNKIGCNFLITFQTFNQNQTKKCELDVTVIDK